MIQSLLPPGAHYPERANPLLTLCHSVGPVARKPVNANPGLNLNRGFNFYCQKCFQKLSKT